MLRQAFERTWSASVLIELLDKRLEALSTRKHFLFFTRSKWKAFVRFRWHNENAVFLYNLFKFPLFLCKCGKRFRWKNLFCILWMAVKGCSYCGDLEAVNEIFPSDSANLSSQKVSRNETLSTLHEWFSARPSTSTFASTAEVFWQRKELISIQHETTLTLLCDGMMKNRKETATLIENWVELKSLKL